MIRSEAVSQELEKLINQAKLSLNEVKVVALAQAWKLLQLAVVETIQKIETINPLLAGKDKKTIAMDCLSTFYDRVFIVVDVPLIPNILEPIIHRYIKTFLMILVGSTIDAMVTTFRQVGVFENKSDPVKTLSVNNTKSKKITKNKRK
jgi:hypothetical protein